MHLVGEPSATQNLRQGQQFKIPRDFSKFWNRDLLKVSHYDSNLQRMFVFNISIRVFWKNILKQFFACKHRCIRHVVLLTSLHVGCRYSPRAEWLIIIRRMLQASLGAVLQVLQVSVVHAGTRGEWLIIISRTLGFLSLVECPGYVLRRYRAG